MFAVLENSTCKQAGTSMAHMSLSQTFVLLQRLVRLAQSRILAKKLIKARNVHKQGSIASSSRCYDVSVLTEPIHGRSLGATLTATAGTGYTTCVKQRSMLMGGPISQEAQLVRPENMPGSP